MEVIRDNEPLYSAESVAPFWCTYVPRNLHLAYLPMLYPSRRFSGLQGRQRSLRTEQGRSWGGGGGGGGGGAVNIKFGYVFTLI